MFTNTHEVGTWDTTTSPEKHPWEWSTWQCMRHKHLKSTAGKDACLFYQPPAWFCRYPQVQTHTHTYTHTHLYVLVLWRAVTVVKGLHREFTHVWWVFSWPSPSLSDLGEKRCWEREREGERDRHREREREKDRERERESLRDDLLTHLSWRDLSCRIFPYHRCAFCDAPAVGVKRRVKLSLPNNAARHRGEPNRDHSKLLWARPCAHKHTHVHTHTHTYTHTHPHVHRPKHTQTHTHTNTHTESPRNPHLFHCSSSSTSSAWKPEVFEPQHLTSRGKQTWAASEVWFITEQFDVTAHIYSTYMSKSFKSLSTH